MDPDFLPDAVDLERPNVARIYDWALGGTANWAVDRQYGELALQAFPLARALARGNRDFLGRAVRYCLSRGITQFLDLGSGIPTAGNVHEVADDHVDDSRCVYVDNEPVAVAHGRILLEEAGDVGRHAVLHADLRDAQDVWAAALATGVLDPDEPICLLSVAVLHFLPDSRRRARGDPRLPEAARAGIGVRAVARDRIRRRRHGAGTDQAAREAVGAVELARGFPLARRDRRVLRYLRRGRAGNRACGRVAP